MPNHRPTLARAVTPARPLSVVLVLAATSLAPPAGAQPADLAVFREAALTALGGPTDTLEYTARGWDACLGQAWAVTEGWARWELTDYRRIIDYRAGTSAQSAMRRAGLDPDRLGGCGAQAGAAASPQQTSIRADAGFSGQLPIWLTPHGVLQLAEAGNATVATTSTGWQLSVPVAGEGVMHPVVADFDTNHRAERIRTWIDDPVFGDMEVVAVLGDYREFGDVTFPESLTLLQGGLATLELTIESVAHGVESPEIGPARGFGGGGNSAGGEVVAIGSGVYVVRGGYQAVAVEFDDFSVVIDGMQNDARTAAVIRLTKESIPGKPIRYVVVTHSHFDHVSGLRQFAAEGATILTHTLNTEFFEAALATPRTLNPNRIEPSNVTATVEGIDARFVLRDNAGQTLELIPLGPSAHAADMLIAYLPAIRTVVESDLLQPWINPIFAGDGPGAHPYLVYLYDELEQAGIDYAQFVPIHQPPDPPTMPAQALIDAVGR
ncbi:MAG: MBL fold metallo-hydrolase [Gammaproteobacteria bacterium]|nr:MBL fold metallo-hydrolase [Gammaproteobacteria bacterium]